MKEIEYAKVEGMLSRDRILSTKQQREIAKGFGRLSAQM
jgi:hypothetical protein